MPSPDQLALFSYRKELAVNTKAKENLYLYSTYQKMFYKELNMKSL